MPPPPRYLPPTGYDPDDARARIASIVRALQRAYPAARTALHYRSTFELLIATILSAQTTDETVNKVTPRLFARYGTAEALSQANPSDVERIIRPTGFFRQKTKAIIGCSRSIVELYDGEVPLDIDKLVKLRGVARKTANVVLSNAASGKGHGIFVDTHVRRVSQRLALTGAVDPVKIERELMAIVPKRRWTDVPHQLIELGRGPCNAKRPQHEGCPLLKWCPTGQAALAPTRRVRAREGAGHGDPGPRARGRRTAGGTGPGRPRRT